MLPILENVGEQLRIACVANDMPSVVQYDMAFHRAIVEGCGGEEMSAIWLPIVVRMMMHYTRHKELMESYREHLAIIDAIRSNDKEKAVWALETNIR